MKTSTQLRWYHKKRPKYSVVHKNNESDPGKQSDIEDGSKDPKCIEHGSENKGSQSGIEDFINLIHPSWLKSLREEFSKAYFIKLFETLQCERKKFVVYPPDSLVFSWSHFTPFESVRVVILGQDPYHVENLATGLAFSLPKTALHLQPSLVNIFKEIQSSLGKKVTFSHGCLEYWASQGVLLLNTTLTVRANAPLSHSKIGWEIFTDRIIEVLSQQPNKRLVFMLWGVHARKKIEVIKNAESHLILTSAHPLSFTAHRDFLGNGHFKKTNEFLTTIGEPIIDWRIP